MAGKTVYGGQAVMEGVMMRGRDSMAVAVRAPDQSIVVYHEPLAASPWALRVKNWPLVRGVVMLWDTMVLGTRALVFSANIGLTEEAEEDQEPSALAGPALWGTVAISILFSIGLFFLLPLLVVHLIDRYIDSSVVSNLVEGLIRLGLLLGYLGLLGNLRDIRRVFGYHGAEHKTINALEAGDPLDVEHVRRHTLLHPRCGTGFLLVVAVISVIVFAFLGRPDFVLRVLSRILLVPVIAAIAYEFLKFTAKHDRNPIVRTVIAPSLAMQRLTTREPDDEMLQVAIVSLQRVLVAEGALSAATLARPGIREVDIDGHVAGQPGAAIEPTPALGID
ncbi:MAG TPA: DUF1385 domain-containing protein [Nitrolancea sp.]|nr:DUF1385 domain-containing protein [Nitrolancea sp.]